MKIKEIYKYDPTAAVIDIQTWFGFFSYAKKHKIQDAKNLFDVIKQSRMTNLSIVLLQVVSLYDSYCKQRNRSSLTTLCAHTLLLNEVNSNELIDRGETIPQILIQQEKFEDSRKKMFEIHFIGLVRYAARNTNHYARKFITSVINLLPPKYSQRFLNILLHDSFIPKKTAHTAERINEELCHPERKQWRDFSGHLNTDLFDIIVLDRTLSTKVFRLSYLKDHIEIYINNMDCCDTRIRCLSFLAKDYHVDSEIREAAKELYQELHSLLESTAPTNSPASELKNCHP